MKPTINVELKSKGKGFLSCKDDKEIANIHNYLYTVEKVYKKGKAHYHDVHQVSPSGLFDVGFFRHIYKKFNGIYSFKATDDFKNALNPKTGMDSKKISTILNFDYHYYQKDAIQKMIEKGRGVVELGTSGGKSLICAGFCKAVLEQQPNKKVLLIAPGISLVNQLYNDIKLKFNIENVSILTSSRLEEYDDTKRIVVTNSECYVNQIKKNQYLELLDFDYVIIDECHRINDNTWISNILSRMKTHSRFGLTGTLPDEGINYYNILGKIGTVIYEKNAKSLRAEDYVAQLKIFMFMLQHKNPPVFNAKDGREYYNMEKSWIIGNEKRNKFIGHLVKKFSNTALILVDKLEYGDNLVQMLNSIGKKAVFIQGSTKIEDREAIQKQMEVSDDMVVVAMDRIFSTGISINNIHHIIFAFIGKGKIKIVQSIGRGLRKNHNKNHVSIYDICDELPCSLKHFDIRKELFEKEVDDLQNKKYRI